LGVKALFGNDLHHFLNRKREENSNTVQTNLESSRIWTMFVAGVDLFFLWPKVYDFFKNQPGYPGDP